MADYKIPAALDPNAPDIDISPEALARQGVDAALAAPQAAVAPAAPGLVNFNFAGPSAAPDYTGISGSSVPTGAPPPELAAPSNLHIEPAMAKIPHPSSPEIQQAEQVVKKSNAEKAATQIMAQDAQQKAREEAQVAQSAVSETKKQDNAAFESISDLFDRGSTGQKWGAALAILAGGISAGMTGKENPVLGFMQQQFDITRRNKQLSQEQQMAQMKAMADQVRLKLDIAKEQTNSEKAKFDIAKTQAEIGKIHQELADKQALGNVAKALSEGGVNNVDEYIAKVSAINPEMAKDLRSRRVQLPDGKTVLAKADSGRVAEFEKFRQPTQSAEALLADIQKTALQGNKLSPEDRLKISTNLKQSAGMLREALLGPGAMTEKEFDRLMSTLGDPNSLSTPKAWQLLKLGEVRKNLNRQIESRASGVGISWPQQKEKQLEEKLIERGASPEQAKKVVDKMVKDGKL